MVGGTALALFYLQHRVSLDLDFVPALGEDEVKLEETLKGCLSKKRCTTQRAKHWNQFIVQSNVTSVKIEVFPRR
ncbi:MAG: nucleotidyl transferase AbiEii/AbiGii toxin family protein [Candidatus Anstonellaceae archaeon]